MRRYEPLERPAAPAADAERPGPSHLPNRVSREVVARVSTKAQAALWVAGMVMLFVYGGVGDSLFDSARSEPCVGARSAAARARARASSPAPPSFPRSTFVYMGLTAFSVAIFVMLYCVVYLRRIRGLTFPWQVIAPGMIETATIAGVASYFCFVAGLWPAYGFLTPIVVAVCYFGFAFSLHFVPPI